MSPGGGGKGWNHVRFRWEVGVVWYVLGVVWYVLGVVWHVLGVVWYILGVVLLFVLWQSVGVVFCELCLFFVQHCQL